MSAEFIIAQLMGVGGILSVDRGKLRLTAPRGVLTGKLKAAITIHKSRIIALLDRESGARSYQRQPPGRVLVQCERSDEVKSAIDWILQSELPESFQLSQGVFVLDGAKFREALLRDVEAGPNGPRARWGALQRDLLRLYRMFTDASGDQ
jgi:hypothetical protein